MYSLDVSNLVPTISVRVIISILLTFATPISKAKSLLKILIPYII